jgi:subtilisin-like proprotein convertase family protein
VIAALTGPNATKLGALALAIWIAMTSSGAAAERTFSSTAPIVVPGAGDVGPASPYPSTIAVSGLPAVTSVRATLSGVSAEFPNDLDVHLFAPAGQHLTLVSDACGELALIAGLQWIFDDAAITAIGVAGCSSGVFWPTNYAPSGPNEIRPPPGSVRTGFPRMEDLITASVNGDWRLFVYDDEAQGSGSIAGWSLSFTEAECGGRPATLAGTSEKDELVGTPGSDVVAALGGSDTVQGLGGKDVICGGDGNDKLAGGRGKDRLAGEGGKDRLRGGGAEDRLLGGAGKDTLRGGKGDDVLKGGAGKDNERQ